VKIEFDGQDIELDEECARTETRLVVTKALWEYDDRGIWLKWHESQEAHITVKDEAEADRIIKELEAGRKG
jgi:hypothetical protein